MCGIINNRQRNEIEPCHSWIFAGDPKYFPYKGQSCDCGLTRYGEQINPNEVRKKEI